VYVFGGDPVLGEGAGGAGELDTGGAEAGGGGGELGVGHGERKHGSSVDEAARGRLRYPEAPCL